MGGPMIFSRKSKRKNGFPTEEDQLLVLEYNQVNHRRVIVELGSETDPKKSEIEQKNKESVSIRGELLASVEKRNLVETFLSVVDDGKGSFIVGI
jgi:hypothetical protein